MKIAQIVALEESVPPQNKNGLEFVVSWLTEELVARGHDVTLFAPENSKTKARLVSLLPPEAWSVTGREWQQPTRSLWNTTYAASMADTFDIIHTHTGTIAFALPFIDKPVVYTLHHPASDDVWRPEFKNHTEQMKFIFEQYSKINYAAVSKHQEATYTKEAGDIYFKNHTTVHNGIPVEKFEFNNSPEDYLLFIGYINENKGAHVAVTIASELKMKLILAGTAEKEGVFFQKYIQPYLSDDIQYIGPVDFDQKVSLYKNAQAVLAPIQWHEPFGLTLVESQACGTPVIAFNKGAAPEVIKHGETGFIVSDEAEMCAAVKKISTIDRKKCRQWVENNFSVSRMVDQYEALYEKILSSKK